MRERSIYFKRLVPSRCFFTVAGPFRHKTCFPTYGVKVVLLADVVVNICVQMEVP
jgi:hypothetical protein